MLQCSLFHSVQLHILSFVVSILPESEYGIVPLESEFGLSKEGYRHHNSKLMKSLPTPYLLCGGVGAVTISEMFRGNRIMECSIQPAFKIRSHSKTGHNSVTEFHFVGSNTPSVTVIKQITSS